MKEALQSPYNKLIFRETFNDEATVRRNGGTPTDVTFGEGKGSFNGSTSKINYNLGLNGTYSVRVRCNPTNFTATNNLLDCRGSNDDGSGVFRTTITTGNLYVSSGTAYVNGVTSTTVIAGVNSELVVTGITIKQGTGDNLSLIGSSFQNTSELIGTMDLLEIYEGTLTASEVANLYNNKWNKEYMSGGEYLSPKTITSPTVESDWTNNGDGSFTCNGAGVGTRVTSNLGIELNKKYLVKITCTARTAGSLVVQLSGSSAGGTIPISAVGSYEAVLVSTATATNTIYIISTGFVGTIRGITTQEIAPDILMDFNSTNGVLEDKTVGKVVGSEKQINSGADGLTDWVDTNSDGLADSWECNQSTTYSIVTGNGFNGNAQRIVQDAGGSYPQTQSLLSTLSAGKKYRAILKYRSSKTLYVRFGATGIVELGSANTGNAKIAIIEGVVGTASPFLILFNANAIAGDWFEVDEVSVKEIKPDLTATDVSIVKDGKYSAKFNGTTSKIDTGTDFIGTKAVTVCGWIKPYTTGEGALGRILENAKFVTHMLGANIRIQSDALTSLDSTGDFVSLNKSTFFSITRTSAGVATFYFGTRDSAPVVNATGTTGTPVVGTTNVIIGNNTGATRTFDGLMPIVRVYEGILDLATITQVWSETLLEIK